MRFLITGGAGFIGSNFVEYLFSQVPDVESVIVLDKFTYAGSLENLEASMTDSRLKIVAGDLRDYELVARNLENVDYVVHFAAESHVDRSIADSTPFVESNVLGTHSLLLAIQKHPVNRVINVSTDEVYGPIRKGSASENSRINPSSPYAASKAAADCLSHSYFVTHNLPVITTHSVNNFGKYQQTEKFIPTIITRHLSGQDVPVYGKGNNIREWIHVQDNCRALYLILQKGNIGENYNIGTGIEISNLEIVKQIFDLFPKTKSQIKFVEDRKGHDYRYSLDSTKLRSLGFVSSTSWKEDLIRTYSWYQKALM
jgi:dTDP-glucose 4,6-dehydratase